MTKEYIERGAVKAWLHEEDFGTPDERWRPESEFGTMIDALPAADVVEVVRCKDCKHFAKGMAVGMCKRIKDRPIIPTTYNHYCSYGERKEQE